MAKNNKSVQRKEIEKTLAFTLTEPEFAARAKQMAELDAEISRVEYERKEAADKFKARIEALEKDRRIISGVVRLGKEERTVMCLQEMDFKEGTVSYLVEGEIIESRPMEPGERQMEIVTAAHKRPAKKGKARAEEAKAEAAAPVEAPAGEKSIRDVIREETRRISKHSAVDGVRTN